MTPDGVGVILIFKTPSYDVITTYLLMQTGKWRAYIKIIYVY